MMNWRVFAWMLVAGFLAVSAARAQEPDLDGERLGELAAARAQLARILTDNIVPFWFPGTLDAADGGYKLNHDMSGAYQGPSDKALVTQARTVWFFSRLYGTEFGKPEHLEAARHGFRFLADRMRDAEHGGYYWAVNHDGSEATRPDKHLYGQSFALYALSEFARAGGGAEALTLANELAALLEYKAHDKVHGGYMEAFRRDWTPLPADETSYMSAPGGVKLMNTHLHLMEAYTTYCKATRDPLARERLLELIDVESNAVVRKTVGACTDRYTRAWLPLLEPPYNRVSYGHDIENVWLLREARDAVGVPNGPLMDLYRTLSEYSLQFGFDHTDGGYYDRGEFNRPADAKTKVWWVQSEALVGALTMYQLTGGEHYWDAFAKTLDFVVRKQVDWEGGDWFSNIGEDGVPSGGKAGAWKSPYHNGRAMIRSIELIDAITVGN